jgi:hypothetical protein
MQLTKLQRLFTFIVWAIIGDRAMNHDAHQRPSAALAVVQHGLSNPAQKMTQNAGRRRTSPGSL